MLLAPRQFAGLGVAIQVNERFGGGNSGFPPPPARDHLLMLAPDTLPVLAHMRKERGLLFSSTGEMST